MCQHHTQHVAKGLVDSLLLRMNTFIATIKQQRYTCIYERINCQIVQQPFCSYITQISFPYSIATVSEPSNLSPQSRKRNTSTLTPFRWTYSSTAVRSGTEEESLYAQARGDCLCAVNELFCTPFWWNMWSELLPVRLRWLTNTPLSGVYVLGTPTAVTVSLIYKAQ